MQLPLKKITLILIIPMIYFSCNLNEYDPSIYKPQAAQFVAEAQDFHHIPENIPTFQGRAFQS